jgi:hypothetical protein
VHALSKENNSSVAHHIDKILTLIHSTSLYNNDIKIRYDKQTKKNREKRTKNKTGIKRTKYSRLCP